MDYEKATKIIATRNTQASFIDAMREMTWNVKVLENWLEDDKDEAVIKKLDAVAEALYDAYHYIGTTRPDRRAITEELKAKAKAMLAAQFGDGNGKSESSEPDRASI